MDHKKLIACICAAVVIGAALPAAMPMEYTGSAFAAENTITGTLGGIGYEVSDGAAAITNCSKDIEGILILPKFILGAPVTTIGDEAFAECSGLVSITLPDGVAAIGDSAFYRCESLTSITIPENVRSIGEHAFSKCWSLTSVTIINKNCVLAENCLSGFLGTMCGYNNSTAETYAEEHFLKFESLGDAPLPLGDVNDDGAVNANDASAVLAEYASVSTHEGTIMTPVQLTAADVNGDGKIDASDASVILEFYAYNSTGGKIADLKEWLANKAD